jgi:HSP20 family protein
VRRIASEWVRACAHPVTGDEGLLPFGGWAFMASDVFDDDDKVIMRIEAPGLRREDFNIELHGDTLSVWGEKRSDREASRGRYSVVQCAYGSFRREVVLPAAVKADKTKASYRDGVLRIELPKAHGARTCPSHCRQHSLSIRVPPGSYRAA